MHQHHTINLCQPDNNKSCSACCGLYNWVDHSQNSLEHILDLQTDLFMNLDNYNDPDSFRNRVKSRIKNTKLFDTIYNCEFLGFIDSSRKQVGCLLHPSITGRNDLRNHCFYGAKVCSEHFCPSYSCLSTEEQTAVINATDDWYLYGLVITDIDLVKEFFRKAENIMGESIKQKKLQEPAVVSALSDFFKLKINWKYKTTENRLGKYYFSEAEYNIARIEYKEKFGLPHASPYDKILISLESEFSTLEELIDAESIIEAKIHRFIDVYQA